MSEEEIKLSPEVYAFAIEMQRRLNIVAYRENTGSWKQLNTWSDSGGNKKCYKNILEHILENAENLIELHADPGMEEAIGYLETDSLDLANYAMFAWYHADKAFD